MTTCWRWSAGPSPAAGERVAEPHPALLAVAAGRPLPAVDDPLAVLRTAVEHGMAGLLLGAVEAGDQPAWAPHLALLRATRMRTRARHQHLWAALGGVTTALAGAGIEVAAAKGVTAEVRWYERTGDRPCADLDLFLCPQQLDRLDDAVAVVEPGHPLAGRVRDLAARGFLQSIDLVWEGVPVDLHWDLLKLGVPSRGRDVLWERTTTVPGPDGTAVRALDAEASFVHFLVHLNRDGFARLLGFADVARISCAGPLDEGAVTRLVDADGLGTCVGASWNVVAETLGLDGPRRDEGGRVRRALWHLVWRPPVRLQGPEAKARSRQRKWLVALLVPGRSLELVRGWARSVLRPPELVAYLQSDYAERWGGVRAVDVPQGYLSALTVGRVRSRLARRRQGER